MAVNILMMTGRFGGVVGANVTSILLYNHCEYAFYVPGCLIAGKRIFCYLNETLLVPILIKLQKFPFTSCGVSGLSYPIQ